MAEVDVDHPDDKRSKICQASRGPLPLLLNSIYEEMEKMLCVAIGPLAYHLFLLIIKSARQ